MNCTKCGYLNNQDANFCVGCGSTFESPKVTNFNRSVSNSPSEEKSKKPVNKRKLIVIFSCCVVVLTAVVFIILYIGKVSDYEKAITLMEDGKHDLALEFLNELEDFRDAVSLSIECQNFIDYDNATQLLSRGEYSQAKLVFSSLGVFKDSASKAEECQKYIDYSLAIEVMQLGEYEKARDIFISLGLFLNSASLIAECDNNLAYNEAVRLMEEGIYEHAIPILEPLITLHFLDSFELLELCNDYIVYNEAITLMSLGKFIDAQDLLIPLASFDFEESLLLLMECIYSQADSAYTEGLFYTAYVLFRDIIGYKDSKSRAEVCIQDNPTTSELFRNSDFSGRSVSVRVRTPRDQNYPTFLKVYNEDGIHISSTFIHGGDSFTLRIPSGTYIFKAAYGQDWFGEEEMFGDVGLYQTLIFDDTTTIRLSSNYTYTLTLGGVTDGNVGAQDESRNDF